MKKIFKSLLLIFAFCLFWSCSWVQDEFFFSLSPCGIKKEPSSKKKALFEESNFNYFNIFPKKQ